jgi:plastocyanin
MKRGVIVTMACGVAACGGGDVISNPPAPNSTGQSTTAGTGGAGSTSASTAGVGGMTGAGGSGGSGTMFVPVNGCDPKTALNQTGKPAVDIYFGYIDKKDQYVPRCVRITAGAQVNFKCQTDPCNFQQHPLQGGALGKKDPNSPFGFVFGEFTEKSFVLKNKGSYPYYCTAHQNVNMAGAVYVE